jgi:hypothetical protein
MIKFGEEEKLSDIYIKITKHEKNITGRKK